MNARIVYNTFHSEDNVCSKDFRLAVAKGMVEGFSSRERAVPKQLYHSLRHNEQTALQNPNISGKPQVDGQSKSMFFCATVIK